MNKRLEKVSELIDKFDLLADIGCDHGYLGIIALNKGVKFVQFIDNKIGPLNQAKKNCQNIDNNMIEFTLASGITKLNDQVNTICICGMGGELICDILEENLDKAKSLNKIILQPNRNEPNLRKYLMNNNFIITNEEIVFENNKYYEIIVCKYVSDQVSYTEEELLLGPILMNKKEEIFVNKWNDKLMEYLRIKDVSNDNFENDKKIEIVKKILE